MCRDEVEEPAFVVELQVGQVIGGVRKFVMERVSPSHRSGMTSYLTRVHGVSPSLYVILQTVSALPT
jgi:hypothetical protein